MKRFSVLLALAMFAIAMTMATVAVAHGWDDDWSVPDVQQGSTNLDLSVDKQVVFPGQTVVLQGQLTVQAADDSSGDSSDGDSTDTVDPTDPSGGDTSTVDPGQDSTFTITCWNGDQGDDADNSDNGDDGSGDGALSPVPGAEVDLYSVIGDQESLVATTTTADDGSFAVPVTIDHGMHFLARFEGDDTNDPAESDVVNVHVFAVTTPPQVQSSAVAGHAILMRGSATSGGGAVTLTVSKPNGKALRTLHSAVKRGRYSATFKLPAGKYQVTAKQAGGNGYLGLKSRPTTLKVRKH